MKKGLAVLLLLLLVISSEAQVKRDYRKKAAPIPPFALEQPDGTLITNRNLKRGKPVLVAIFSPKCDHCALALDTLLTFGERLANTQIILATEARHKPFLKDFMSSHGYDKAPLFNMVGIDRSNLIFDIYTYGLLPQFNIYNAHHKLVKSINGVFPMDSLKKSLR